MIIRTYVPSDRPFIEDIQFQTYLLGKPIAKFCDDKKSFAREINYYFDKEPESIFVVVEHKKIVGYLLGCLDDKKHHEIRDALFSLVRNIFMLPFMSAKNRKFQFQGITFFFSVLLTHSDVLLLKNPTNAGHIHINLLPEARGKGVGSKLLKKFFTYAKSKGVTTIVAGSFETRLNPNEHFWLKNGFVEYSKVPTKMWKYAYPNEKISVVSYVKKL